MKNTSPLNLASFVTPLVITAVLSYLSAKGVVRAKDLLGEQLVPNTFELFAYICLTMTGFVGAFHPEPKTLLFSAAKGAGIWVANIVFGAGGALVGWGVGLLVATAASSSPQQLIAHIGLVSFMALIALAPAWAFEQTVSARAVNKRPETYNRAVRLVLFVVGCTGGYGFWSFWFA